MKRLLFVLIALMGISATALAERVTAIEQIDPEVEYYIYSQRATLLYCTDLPEKLATTNGTQVSDAPNPLDPNQQWKFEIDGEDIYLYNVGANKYIGAEGIFEDTRTTPVLIEEKGISADYPWYFSVGGLVFNSQDPGYFANGILIDGWTMADPGNSYSIIPVSDAVSELFEPVKSNAIELLNSGLYFTEAATNSIAAIEAISIGTTPEAFSAAIAEVNSIVESTAINTAELFYIKSVAHGQYLTATTATSFAGAPERSHYAVWQFKPAVGGGYHLFEAAQQVYMPETAKLYAAMNPVIEENAGVYTIHVAQSSGAVYLKSNNPTNADFPCIHDDKANNKIVGWRADVAASHWEITIVPLEHREEYHSGEDFQKALELLADNIAGLEGLVEYLSDEYTLGKYYSTRGNETVLTGLQAAKDFYATAATSAGIEAIYKMAATVTDLKNTITAYQPLPGRYYRARSLRGGKAITSNPTQDGKRLALEETNTRPFSSVMYVTQDGYVHSFSAGQLFTNFMGEDQSLLPIGETTGYSAMFGVGETYGYYTISFGKNDDEKDVFLAAVSGKYVEGRTKDQLDSKVLSIDLDWELEAITELPIVVSPDGFATIYTPTAVQCPEGVKAYSGVINEAEGLVDLKSYPDGLIPAGTAVMIKAEASAIESVPGSDSKIVNLEVLDEATIDAQDNDFEGSYFTEEAPENICTLQMINGEMGFYRYNGTYIKGFKGYLPIPSTLGTIRFRFADGTTTDIDAATLETAPTTYYDLSGRRVLNPTRGVYVTASGKKVFVK